MNPLIDLLCVSLVLCVLCCNSPITETQVHTMIVKDTCKPMPQCVNPLPPEIKQ